MRGKHGSKVFLIIAFLMGLGIFIYPTLSDYFARRTVIQGATTYERELLELGAEEIEGMWEEARKYNDSLNGNPVPDPFIPGSGRVLPENYLRVLNVGDGIMGYVDIPDIQVYLPIYHGTSEEILEQGAGHIEQTSLPIGGIGNLSVLTAHTGFSGAEMFNRLTELTTGDTFMIHVLDAILTYEVDDIRVILPDEIETLFPVEGEDYITLVTCTPYGINSHRLLVRGTRIENLPEIERSVESIPFPRRIILMIIIAILFFVLILKWNANRDKEGIETTIETQAEKTRRVLDIKMREVAREREVRRSEKMKEIKKVE